jgi:hypothetical protein
MTEAGVSGCCTRVVNGLNESLLEQNTKDCGNAKKGVDDRPEFLRRPVLVWMSPGWSWVPRGIRAAHFLALSLTAPSSLTADPPRLPRRAHGEAKLDCWLSLPEGRFDVAHQRSADSRAD